MYDELFDTHHGADQRRAALRRQRLLAVCVAVAAFALVGALTARSAFTDTSSAAAQVAVRAAASGVVVLSGSGERATPQRIASVEPVVGGRTEDQQAKARYRYPADGSVIDASQISASGRVREGTRSARSRSDVGTVRLLGGRIELRNASLTADARMTGGAASGAFTLRPGATLLVDGKELPLTENRIVTVGDVATVTINEQAVVALAPKGDEQTGPRARVVGALVHLRLAKPLEGLPAGAEIIVGRVEAGVRQGKVDPVTHPGVDPAVAPTTPAGLPSGTGAAPNLQAGVPKPGEGALPRRDTTVRAGALPAAGGLNSYLFPILGPSSYSNDWGAPRASTGMGHQGNDIFATEGTPVVAIADGVLDRVGWNSIGGYRFWLFDGAGNAFYHAHLSAFSPLAQDGARVRAGDVIGFVGHTGDAQGTPDHVHFEIHPGNGAATNPFPFLNNWKRGIATAIGALGVTEDGSMAPLTLIEGADISPNSGLEGSVLDRVVSGKRPVAEETKPKPTDDTLRAAIDGDGIAAQ